MQVSRCGSRVLHKSSKTLAGPTHCYPWMLVCRCIAIVLRMQGVNLLLLECDLHHVIYRIAQNFHPEKIFAFFAQAHAHGGRNFF